jgi:hypothetical protein
MYHGYSQNSENTQEFLDVCKPDAPVEAETFLKQNCWVSEMDQSSNTHNFTCERVDATIGCDEPGQVIFNPNPGRVCYEMGNGCMNSQKTKQFSKQLEYRWRLAELPAGVKITTYGQPSNPNLIIGRNPRYSGQFEKLWWNNTFFDRSAVDERVAAMSGEQRLFAYVVQSTTTMLEPTARRRLLNSDTAEVSIGENKKLTS